MAMRAALRGCGILLYTEMKINFILPLNLELTYTDGQLRRRHRYIKLSSNLISATWLRRYYLRQSVFQVTWFTYSTVRLVVRTVSRTTKYTVNKCINHGRDRQKHVRWLHRVLPRSGSSTSFLGAAVGAEFSKGEPVTIKILQFDIKPTYSH